MTTTKSERKNNVGHDSVADPMERYMVRDRANVPKRIFLFDPATRKQTEDYIDIYSSLSDGFRDARDTIMQSAAELAEEKDDTVRKLKMHEEQLKLYSSLIGGWSFNKPCTEANKVEFLRQAPQIKNMVVAVADDNETFFGDASVS